MVFSVDLHFFSRYSFASFAFASRKRSTERRFFFSFSLSVSLSVELSAAKSKARPTLFSPLPCKCVSSVSPSAASTVVSPRSLGLKEAAVRETASFFEAEVVAAAVHREVGLSLFFLSLFFPVGGGYIVHSLAHSLTFCSKADWRQRRCNAMQCSRGLFPAPVDLAGPTTTTTSPTTTLGFRARSLRPKEAGGGRRRVATSYARMCVCTYVCTYVWTHTHTHSLTADGSSCERMRSSFCSCSRDSRLSSPFTNTIEAAAECTQSSSPRTTSLEPLHLKGWRRRKAGEWTRPSSAGADGQKK